MSDVGTASARATDQAAALERLAKRPSAQGKTSAKWQRAMRWLHVYSSMIAFLVILFFGVTGLLLNHPSWLFGDEVTTTRDSGRLPESVRSDDGSVEFLAVSEFIRETYDVQAGVTNFDQVDEEGSINYAGAGYGSTVRFDVTSLDYEITEREEGFVNAMRDLHAGRDTGGTWSLIIDISAVFLVFVAVTGLGIQLFMRKRRQKALAWLAVGTAGSVFLIWLTLV